MVALLACGVFFAWFACSVIAQFDGSKLHRRDAFDLLPYCKFFAPKPISEDVAIYCRLVLPSSEHTEWELLYPYTRNWWCAVWNPHHRLQKSVGDLVQQLAAIKRSGAPLHVSHPYVVILGAVCERFVHAKGQGAVQFFVTYSLGFENVTPNVIIKSPLHAIG